MEERQIYILSPEERKIVAHWCLRRIKNSVAYRKDLPTHILDTTHDEKTCPQFIHLHRGNRKIYYADTVIGRGVTQRTYAPFYRLSRSYSYVKDNLRQNYYDIVDYITKFLDDYGKKEAEVNQELL